jgi:hypothetical protein
MEQHAICKLDLMLVRELHSDQYAKVHSGVVDFV